MTPNELFSKLADLFSTGCPEQIWEDIQAVITERDLQATKALKLTDCLIALGKLLDFKPQGTAVIDGALEPLLKEKLEELRKAHEAVDHLKGLADEKQGELDSLLEDIDHRGA